MIFKETYVVECTFPGNIYNIKMCCPFVLKSKFILVRSLEDTLFIIRYMIFLGLKLQYFDNYQVFLMRFLPVSEVMPLNWLSWIDISLALSQLNVQPSQRSTNIHAWKISVGTSLEGAKHVYWSTDWATNIVVTI